MPISPSPDVLERESRKLGFAAALATASACGDEAFSSRADAARIGAVVCAIVAVDMNIGVAVGVVIVQMLIKPGVKSAP